MWRLRCFRLYEPTEDPDAIARGQEMCREIARRANANFQHAALLLPVYRREYFYATYAAMRVIDDLVDEDFLGKPDADRRRSRADVLEAIEAWERQTTRFDNRDGPLHGDIVTALAATAGRSDLGIWPWKALAGAMRRDAEEREIRTWLDFLDYCDGATVAPAGIFVYLLSVRRGNDGFYRYPLDRTARDYAKDLAIYCYIVHILRDLAKDAALSPRLISIPVDILENAGLKRDDVADAVENRSPTIDRLTGELIERALPHRDRGHAALAELSSRLGFIERKALNGLLAIYDELFDRARENSFILMTNGSDIEKDLRRNHLKTDGAN